LRTTAGRSLLAAVAAALLIPAQAPAQVPHDAVALVGDRPLTRATFDHWFRIAAISLDSQTLGPSDVPHRYGACPSRHGHRCRVNARALRDQSMQYLIGAYWIEGESALQGVSATDAEVAAEFDRLRRQSFPRVREFRRFLRENGFTVEDLRYRSRVQLLSERLRAHVYAGVAPVTDDDVAAYYVAHAKQLRVPRTRDIRYIHTRFAWRAYRAYQLLQQGKSWSRVVALLSIDNRSRMTVARGGSERVLDRAIFGARLHRLHAPVHATAGYYVFEVTAAHPAHRLTLKEYAPQIRSILEDQRREAALDDFVRDFQQRWRSATVCRSGFITPDCGNAPS